MTRRPRPARWPLALLAVAFASAGIVALVDGRGDDGDGSTSGGEMVVATTTVPIEVVAGEPDPIRTVREPYALIYRVEGFTGDGGAVIDREHRWVRPPYASRVETVPDGADADPTFLQVSSFGVLQNGREGETPTVIVVEPGAAPGDARVDVAALDWRHEERKILDRRCQVFRSGGPIDVGTLEPPTADTWADLCVGDDGLVLQEDWVIGGKVFRRRTAVELDQSPDFDPGVFEPTGTVIGGNGGGRLTALTDDSRPPGVISYELLEPPAGFARRGRYGYTPPRVQVDVAAPEPPKIALILDLFEDGEGRFLVVANGGSSDYSPSVQVDGDDTTVDLGPIGIAEVVPGLRQNELRVGFERGRFLRVYGTLPVEQLASLARSLRANADPNGTVTAKAR